MRCIRRQAHDLTAEQRFSMSATHTGRFIEIPLMLRSLARAELDVPIYAWPEFAQPTCVCMCVYMYRRKRNARYILCIVPFRWDGWILSFALLSANRGIYYLERGRVTVSGWKSVKWIVWTLNAIGCEDWSWAIFVHVILEKKKLCVCEFFNEQFCFYVFKRENRLLQVNIH